MFSQDWTPMILNKTQKTQKTQSQNSKVAKPKNVTTDTETNTENKKIYNLLGEQHLKKIHQSKNQKLKNS